jgi:FHS family L-fucose permease-like MFS transporter
LDIKKTLSAGLLSAVGSFLLFCYNGKFSFLAALFTVGLGFSIQQIVANPLAIKKPCNWCTPLT